MGNNLIRMRGKTPKHLPEKSAGLSRDAPGNALSRQGAAHGEPEDSAFRPR